jgi:hypothetical protein
MNISNKNDIIDIINFDWSGSKEYPDVRNACMKIVEYLIKSDLSKINYLNYGDLLEITQDQVNLLPAVQYLTGDRLKLLNIKFELITDDDESIDIAPSTINQAKAVGVLEHPETGEEICNFEEKVFIYFQPSSLAKQYLI